MAVDLFVETPNPQALDQVVQNYEAAVVQNSNGEYSSQFMTVYRVRVLREGDVDFLKFIIQNQGYGQVLGQEIVSE